MQGQRDFALSERGLAQSDKLANYLKTNLVPNLSKVAPARFYCSPLQRTRQTLAPTLNAFPDISCHEDPQLVEVDSGIFSGLTWEEAGEKYPEERERFAKARDWGAVPGGESKVELWRRAAGFLTQLASEHSADDFVVVMSHGGFIRACLSHLASVPPDAPVFVCIDNTALSLAGMHNQRHYIRYVNDTRHLHCNDFDLDYIPR